MTVDQDPGDENDHIERCAKDTSSYGRIVPCGRPLGHDGQHARHPVRGIDVACEECGALSGCFYERGFARCRACGYPGQ